MRRLLSGSAAVALVAVLVIAGCGNVQAVDPIDQAGSMGGAGGPDGGTADAGPPVTPATFVGVWTIKSGMFQEMCSGLPTATQDFTGEKLMIVAGTTSDLTSSFSSAIADCTLPLTVVGSTAIAVHGQWCDFINVATGTTEVRQTVNVSGWTISAFDLTMPTIMVTADTVGVAGLADGCPGNIAITAMKR